MAASQLSVSAISSRSRREHGSSTALASPITAGFWNSHVHFIERKWANVSAIPADELTEQLRSMLTRYGFTSVLDTGSMWENTRRLRDRVESGELPGPRIRSTGEILTYVSVFILGQTRLAQRG